MTTRQQQSGFLLPLAIFLLVVLAGLGAYALNITSVQTNVATLDIQSTRAYHAARAGLEWAVYQIINTTPAATLPACPSNTFTLDGFQITVSCTIGGDYLEQGGAQNIRIYEITSLASHGTANTSTYVERQIDISLSKCIDQASSPNEVCS